MYNFVFLCFFVFRHSRAKFKIQLLTQNPFEERLSVVNASTLLSETLTVVGVGNSAGGSGSASGWASVAFTTATKAINN